MYSEAITYLRSDLFTGSFFDSTLLVARVLLSVLLGLLRRSVGSVLIVVLLGIGFTLATFTSRLGGGFWLSSCSLLARRCSGGFNTCFGQQLFGLSLELVEPLTIRTKSLANILLKVNDESAFARQPASTRVAN